MNGLFWMDGIFYHPGDYPFPKAFLKISFSQRWDVIIQYVESLSLMRDYQACALTQPIPIQNFSDDHQHLVICARNPESKYNACPHWQTLLKHVEQKPSFLCISCAFGHVCGTPIPLNKTIGHKICFFLGNLRKKPLQKIRKHPPFQWEKTSLPTTIFSRNLSELCRSLFPLRKCLAGSPVKSCVMH